MGAGFESPMGRLAGSLVMLGLFYWMTLAPNASASADAGLSSIDVDALVADSRDRYASGQYAQALAPTEALVGRFPTQHVYLERLAFIYERLARYRDAAAAWHRYMERSPTPWDACPAVARAHTADRNESAAFAAHEACWEAAPWDPDAAFYLARAREHRGEVDEAARMYRRSLEIDANHADSQLGLARLDLHANRLDEARQMASAVVARFPEHADAHLVLAQAAQRKGDAGEARQHFERTLTIEERYFDAHVGLGILDFSESHVGAARQHFERALALDASRRAEVSVWLERTEAAAR